MFCNYEAQNKYFFIIAANMLNFGDILKDREGATQALRSIINGTWRNNGGIKWYGPEHLMEMTINRQEVCMKKTHTPAWCELQD